MRDERTGIGLVLALVTLALLAFAFVTPWWSFEESTGRQAPPGGPQGETSGVERWTLDFYPERWEGDIEPTDANAARASMLTLRVGLFVAAGSLALFALGQVPGPSRLLGRLASMVLAGISLAAVAAALLAGWFYLPTSMAAAGVDGPFTAELATNYIRTHLHLGWALGLFAALGSLSCVLAAYSAGDARPSVIEEFRAVSP